MAFIMKASLVVINLINTHLFMSTSDIIKHSQTTVQYQCLQIIVFIYMFYHWKKFLFGTMDK